MGRRPKVQRTAEEKFAIVLEALKSGNVAETCRKHEIAPTLFYRWKDEMEKGALAALGGEKRSQCAARRRTGQAHQATGACARSFAPADRDTKKRVGRVSCGQAHSSARQFVAQGCQATLVAETVGVSRSSLYYKSKPHPSRADRSLDGVIVEACGAKPAYGYRRVAWWMHRKQGLEVNGKRVMRERGLLVTPRRLRARRKKEWSRIVAEAPNQLWQTDMTKLWAGSSVGWAYLVSVIDCCTRDIVGWDLSPRCRTQEAIAAVERAVLEQMADGSRHYGLTLNTDNGTQFTSTRFLETLSRLGITHRRTAFNHPEGNGMIERFHRSLKEEEIWLNEYRSLEEARQSIAKWIEEYNHDRPHRALKKPNSTRSPRELRTTSTTNKYRDPDCLV